MRVSLEELRSWQLQDRHDLKEQQHLIMRMKKYDEFFADCNEKILANQQEIKDFDKKIQEQITSLWNNKYVLAEKVSQFEADLESFVIEYKN